MNLKFKAWIYSNGGPGQLSKKLGLHRQTIYRWLWSEKKPGKNVTKKILMLSKGFLTEHDLGVDDVKGE